MSQGGPALHSGERAINQAAVGNFTGRNEPCYVGVARGACAQLGDPMNNYSIVRIGNEYIVQVNERGVLKIASRRMAKLVHDAAELLDQAPPSRHKRSPV